MSDRGGETNSSKPTFDKVNKGNPEGRGGATFSTGIGPIGTYPLGTKPTNPNTNTKVGAKQPAS